MFEIATRDFPFRSHFPGYRKRKVIVVPTTRVSVHDLNWSGGTRSEYYAVTLSDVGATVSHLNSWNAYAPWANPREGSTIDLAPGCAVVRTGFFCGKVSTMTVYVHPDDVKRFQG